MLKEKVFFTYLLIICVGISKAQTSTKIEYFPLQDIRLTESPFLRAQELNKHYLLELDADRLLAPFLREAGLPSKGDSYTNWENTGLDGHIGGHYLSALSYMYASTGDLVIKERLDYMLSELKRVQDANGNGYIGGVPGGKKIWDEVCHGNINAGGFSLNGKWVPLYNIHKTYAGLRDVYLNTGNEQAKEMLIKMTDWAIHLVSQLSEDQIQDMLRSEHGGLNEVFADVAAITGEKKYLSLAHQFSHHVILDPLLKKEDRLTGLHANTQIPKVLGYKRIADVENNSSWSEAARFFWETVINNRSVCIGGNSTHEHFNSTDDFSRMIKSIEGPETCNTYNMLRLSRMFYQTSLDRKYVDYYEKALYNHILSSQHPETGGLVYFTQMRPDHYRVYSQPQTSMWCCVGSGIENHSKYGEMIYAHRADELYINLFIPSTLKWKEKKTEIIQKTTFPDESKTQLIVKLEKATSFTLKVRQPEWVKGNVKVSLNGKQQAVTVDENGYISINRKWKKNDKLEIEMPMSLRVEQLPDKSNYYSILYGPIVLAAKTSQDDLKGLFADDSRGGHITQGKQMPLKNMPIIVSNPDSILDKIKPMEGKPLTFHLSGLYPDDYSKGLELIPFFRLHDSRYIIYWAQATKDEVKRIQHKIDLEESDRIKLDNITIDKVTCGEQQPESDHFAELNNSQDGFIEDIHWREAKGWFSYKLKNGGKSAKYLYLKYLDNNPSRSFDVFVNDERIVTLSLKGGGNETLVEKLYRLPQSVREHDVINVKFKAHEKSITGKIAEVRLLNENVDRLSSAYRYGPAEKDYTAYLFAYFTGNRVEEEAVHYAISTDGRKFLALNNNQPVIDSKLISNTGGVRDPHILRAEDGRTFYMVLTDMTSSKGWSSNRGLTLLKSKDLVNWSSSILDLQKKYPNQDALKRVWAPQTIFDAETGKYMVYFSMQHGDAPDIIYYAYATDDFTDFESEPQPLFLPKSGKSCIDGDIVKKDSIYYMFYKTEGHGNGIKLATTKSLTSGEWTEHEEYKQQTYDAVEGACVFKLINSEKYILMYDVYMKGKYQFAETSDLEHFRIIDDEISMDFHPRHGTVIPITDKELNSLLRKWGKPKDFIEPQTRMNPVIEGYYADPEILYSQKNKKYYLYPTSDGFTSWSGYYFKTFSSDNLKDWKDEGVILDLKKDVSWADRNAWAPCIEEKKINGEYKYFYYFTAAQKIGVAVANDPVGPFVDSGRPLVSSKPEGVKGGQEIDPDVFTDPVSGKSYLYWGNGYAAVAELNDDMVSIKENTTKVLTLDNTFREGIYVFYRKGLYYFLWSEDDTRSENYSVRYGTSKSPLGPISIPKDNLILSKKPELGIYATGHNSVLQIPEKDEWYIVYHRFAYPSSINMGKAAGYHREVCIDKLEFDSKKNIKKVVPSF